MTRRTAVNTSGGSRHATGRKPPRSTPAQIHPRSVPNLIPENDAEQAPDQPFAGGTQSEIDPDLRHRMISEAAYGLYARRNFADGGDLDDWLQAEAQVEHLLRNRGTGDTGSA
jgi:hypothetical protein